MRYVLGVLIAGVVLLGSGSCQRANRASHNAPISSAPQAHQASTDFPDFLGVRPLKQIIYLTPKPAGPTLCAGTSSIPDITRFGCSGGNSKSDQLGLLTVPSAAAETGQGARN